MNLETYRPSQEILRLVAEIDEFKGAWRLLRNIAPERLTALRRVATIESVGSSTRIEAVEHVAAGENRVERAGSHELVYRFPRQQNGAIVLC